MGWVLRCMVLLAGLMATGSVRSATATSIEWLHDEPSAFRAAAASGRPVLLYLEAVWCHWCHVIDRETYGNPEVAALIAEHFIPLRIDQDHRPDLANRYRDYGWPATIFLTPDGRDMVKRQGYIAPEPMARLLRAIIADPSPEAAAALALPNNPMPGSQLPDSLRQTLVLRHLDSHDAKAGGLKLRQKFVDRDSVELDLVLAGEGDRAAEARARRTLDAGLALIDPVWGGVYQYSTRGDWDHPHYEKLAVIQGEYLRLYALAAARLDEPRYRQATDAIQRYIAEFLTSPEGGFYTSQDADRVPGEKAADYFALDDAGRRELGLPRVDRHRYGRENGVLIEALATRHELDGDAQALALALAAANWTIDQRRLAPGGFRHDASDPAGPYLGDNLAMGRGLLALYRATAEREWLTESVAAADFIDQRFHYQGAGYRSAAPDGGSVIEPVPQIDENIGLARFVNLLARFTGEARFTEMAERALGYLAHPAVATSRLTEAGILLADRELNRDPLHLTVLGEKSDPRARALFETVRGQAGWYKRAEWWDAGEGPLPNPDVTYPQLDRPAAFVCTDQRCSLPIFEAAGVARFLSRSDPA